MIQKSYIILFIVLAVLFVVSAGAFSIQRWKIRNLKSEIVEISQEREELNSHISKLNKALKESQDRADSIAGVMSIFIQRKERADSSYKQRERKIQDIEKSDPESCSWLNERIPDGVRNAIEGAMLRPDCN